MDVPWAEGRMNDEVANASAPAAAVGPGADGFSGYLWEEADQAQSGRAGPRTDQGPQAGRRRAQARRGGRGTAAVRPRRVPGHLPRPDRRRVPRPEAGGPGGGGAKPG